MAASRSYRNNNPGNLEMGAFSAKCRGVLETGVKTPRFARFPHAPAGVAALARLLAGPTYEDRSISAAIKAFAPPKENLTNAYIAAVCKDVGIDKYMSIKSLDALQFISMLHAMTKHEGYHP